MSQFKTDLRDHIKCGCLPVQGLWGQHCLPVLQQTSLPGGPAVLVWWTASTSTSLLVHPLPQSLSVKSFVYKIGELHVKFSL